LDATILGSNQVKRENRVIAIVTDGMRTDHLGSDGKSLDTRSILEVRQATQSLG
jgi:hypothetical protein